MTATPLKGTTAVNGVKVRRLRRALNLSRAELAVMASKLSGENVSVDTIGAVEREEHEVSASRLRAIVMALGVTADEVLR